ncbi:MAG: hypothetical protein ABIG39_01695 [Candidatus Micrarchaeota archaeon]
MIKRVLIRYNTSKRTALVLRGEVKDFLRGQGVTIVDRQDLLLSKWGESKIPHVTYYSRSAGSEFEIGDDAKYLVQYKDIARKEKADLLITIGGDGTLLFYKGFYDMPIFAIGSKTSFLCHATGKDWKSKLLKVIKNPKSEEHPMLVARIGRYKTEAAMNEICVKNPRHRMLRFELSIGKKKYLFGADGVIFSTSIGSSAYAYSAGGKQFSEKDFYEIVPVAPHRRSFKPMFIKDDIQTVLRIHSRYQHDVVDIVVDGQIIYEMGLNASLRICKSKRSVLMVI